MSILLETSRSKTYTLSASVEMRIDINPVVIKGKSYIPNVLQIRNGNSTDYVYMAYETGVSSSNYILSVPPLASQINVTDRNKSYIHVISASNCVITFNTFYDPSPNVTDLDNTNNITVLNQSLTVSNVGISSIASGTNLIGKFIISDGTEDAGVNSDNSLSVKDVTAGEKADNRSSATDTTPVSQISLLKQLSYMLQNPASIASGSNNIGKITIDDIDAGEIDKPSTTPVIYNDTCASASTEYSRALPSNCKKFSIGLQSKDDTKTYTLKFGSSGTEFTLQGNETYSIDGIYLSSQTLYFEVDTAGEVIQIIAWS